jgi:hypothetical protein
MSHDPLAGLLRSFNLTTMASIYGDTLAQAEQPHWGYRKFLPFAVVIADTLRRL